MLPFLAAVIVLLSCLEWLLPRIPNWLSPLLSGMRPLLIPGALAVVALIVFRLLKDPAGSDQTLWPLILASAAFFYLWWLSALIFDLVFVWHRYMHTAALQHHLAGLRQKRKDREAGERGAKNEEGSGSPLSAA